MDVTNAALNQALAVQPDDQFNFLVSGDNRKSQAIYVGIGGDVNAVFPDGTAILLSNVPSGTWLPIKIQRVNNSLTTAQQMVAFFHV